MSSPEELSTPSLLVLAMGSKKFLFKLPVHPTWHQMHSCQQVLHQTLHGDQPPGPSHTQPSPCTTLNLMPLVTWVHIPQPPHHFGESVIGLVAQYKFANSANLLQVPGEHTTPKLAWICSIKTTESKYSTQQTESQCRQLH